MLSQSIGQSRAWDLDSLRSRLATVHLQAVHKAIEAYKAREGKRPPSLGALLVAGDLADAAMLRVPGDAIVEPVLLDDKELAKSSFRYYPEGLTISPDGNEIKAMLIALNKGTWYRHALDLDGQVHTGWGEFAEQSIEAIEQAARAAGKHKHE